MRKDFLTEPYQLLEARAAGAGGALIIVTMLDDATVGEMLACADELGLFVLLEGFDSADLERIAELGATADPQRVLAGVNCRDLKNLQVDFDRFASLAEALPQRLHCVAESGVSSPEDIRTVAELGYRLALVGSALMTTGNPAAALREFISAGRDAGTTRASA
jgi:indole-3-glycerol phosphate synthase